MFSSSGQDQQVREDLVFLEYEEWVVEKMYGGELLDSPLSFCGKDHDSQFSYDVDRSKKTFSFLL